MWFRWLEKAKNVSPKLWFFGGDVYPMEESEAKHLKNPTLAGDSVYIHPSTIKIRIIRYVTEMVEVVLRQTPHRLQMLANFSEKKGHL